MASIPTSKIKPILKLLRPYIGGSSWSSKNLSITDTKFKPGKFYYISPVNRC